MPHRMPTVDVDDLVSSDPVRRDRAAQAVLSGYSELGLCAISGHDIPNDLVEAFDTEIIRFTRLSNEEKAKVASEQIWYQRGWTPPNTERAVVAGGQPDFKECYFAAPIPLDPEPQIYMPEIYADNLWPEGMEDFKRLYLEIGRRTHDIGLLLLRAAARALTLDEETFVRIVEGGPHVTRAIKYLPLTAEQVEQNLLWAENHTDFNLLTLLPAGRFYDPNGNRAPKPDEGGGLFLKTRQGDWVSGIAPAGHVVSQVGQQLEILTGGSLIATPHVVKPTRTPGWSRTSVAHFVHAHASTPLFPLRPFRTPQTMKAYGPPVLAGTYAVKTLVDIGLAPASALDHFGYRNYDALDATYGAQGRASIP